MERRTNETTPPGGGAAQSYSIGAGSGTFCSLVTAAIVEQTAVHL